MILFQGNIFLRNPIGHLSVYTIRLLGLCSNRLPLGLYDPHIMLGAAPLNKIDLVLAITNFLNLFD